MWWTSGSALCFREHSARLPLSPSWLFGVGLHCGPGAEPGLTHSFTLAFLLFLSQVLKAIGLQRTGKQEEAFTLAQEVAALEPTDDNSLQALTILYREMHRRK